MIVAYSNFMSSSVSSTFCSVVIVVLIVEILIIFNSVNIRTKID